jgi:hypothetical protein
MLPENGKLVQMEPEMRKELKKKGVEEDRKERNRETRYCHYYSDMREAVRALVARTNSETSLQNICPLEAKEF